MRFPLVQGPLATLALVCASTLGGCVAVELGYRVHTARPVFVLGNWRVWRIEDQAFGDHFAFDPVLGWAPKAWQQREHHNTLEHGIRRNGEDEEEVRTGGMLAVGGSFTDGGTDAEDDETWPAQLEGLTGAPVLNAGVAGYASDQIVLRAEQLLPLVRPNTLIVAFAADEIARAGLASFSAPKPYFTLENGGLKLHPAAPPTAQDNLSGWQRHARDVLSYSAVLDVVLDQLAPGYWLGAARDQEPRKVDNDPVAVTCALLQRLKGRTDAEGVRLLLLLQYGRQTVADKEQPPEEAKKVGECAAAAGVAVVDQFESLRALAAKPEALGALYLQEEHGQALLSDQGNGQAAKSLAAALAKP
jgi:hypothetical protein